jgi:hypothetical protein
MSGALSDIQQELDAGIAASGATWVGDAADRARGALGPLGEWAQQASTAADVMRASVELQGDLLAKARADMPAPVTVPQPTSQISQLVTAQVDYEVAEMASQVAAHDAYQVMAQYEAATADNTNTLGDFGQPPSVVVDTGPVTGAVTPRSVGFAERSGRFGGSPSGRFEGSRSGRSGGSSTDRVVGSADRAAGSARRSVASDRSTGSSSARESDGAAQESTEPSSASTGRAAGAEVSSRAGGSTIPSSAGGSTVPSGAGGGRDRRSGSSSQVGGRFSGGAVVPAARRPDDGDDQGDVVHESRYLLEAEDIYGAQQTYSPPVIGESGPRR